MPTNEERINDEEAKKARSKQATRNKWAGSNHERDEVRRYRKYFHDVETTRLCNRARDGQGIDLCSQDEGNNGRLPFDISCKCTVSGSLPHVKLFVKMRTIMRKGKDGKPKSVVVDDDRIKIIHHRHTRKSEEGRFITKGEYVVMESDGYELFLQHVYAIQVLRELSPEAVAVLENTYGLKLLNFTHQLPKTQQNDSTH